MVERAKSTKCAEIRKVIAQGDVCFDAPEGKVCIDPKSQHMSHTIYMAKVGDDHKVTFPKVWNDINAAPMSPWRWPGSACRCRSPSPAARWRQGSSAY